jgi:hypothetical protein
MKINRDELQAGLKQWKQSGGVRKINFTRKDLLRAIKQFCLDCYGILPQKHCICLAPECKFQSLRGGVCRTTRKDENGNLKKELNKNGILKTIRAECQECLGTHDVAQCCSPNCALFPFRYGKATNKHWAEEGK